jgi:hypothetical protein
MADSFRLHPIANNRVFTPGQPLSVPNSFNKPRTGSLAFRKVVTPFSITETNNK